MATPTDDHAAAIAAHRFGLGEPDLAVIGSDARGWLRAQIGPADADGVPAACWTTPARSVRTHAPGAGASSVSTRTWLARCWSSTRSASVPATRRRTCKRCPTFRATDGDLAAVYGTLLNHAEAWPTAAAKLRPPEQWAIACLRMLRAGDQPDQALLRAVEGFATLAGEPPGQPPSPAGFADETAAWLGADALLKRVEWAERVARQARRLGRAAAASLARASLGPRLTPATAAELSDADPETLAVFLVSPEVLFR